MVTTYADCEHLRHRTITPCVNDASIKTVGFFGAFQEGPVWKVHKAILWLVRHLPHILLLPQGNFSVWRCFVLDREYCTSALCSFDFAKSKGLGIILQAFGGGRPYLVSISSFAFFLQSLLVGLSVCYHLADHSGGLLGSCTVVSSAVYGSRPSLLLSGDFAGMQIRCPMRILGSISPHTRVHLSRVWYGQD